MKVKRSLMNVHQCSSKKGIVITTTLLEGNPASIILEFSQSEKYEVIIIGSRGMGQFKELAVGKCIKQGHSSFIMSSLAYQMNSNRIPCL